MVPSEIMRRIEEGTSSKLFEEFPHLKKRYWEDFFGTRIFLCNGRADDGGDYQTLFGTSLRAEAE